MEHLKSGRVDALAALFERYQRLVFAVARRILGDSAEAEDLAQDVFIEIYRKANLYDPEKGERENLGSAIRVSSQFQPAKVPLVKALS
jgi:RNA polymerase sigma-70 factor (ECF subfamily)